MRRPSRRGLPALGTALAGITLAGASLAACSAGAPSDPYELVVQSTKATWSPIQVNIGLTATDAGETLTLDPADLAIVIDETAGKGAFHLSLPVSALKIPAAALTQLGVSGDSIDFDLVDDGGALYAKSPFLKPMVTMLLGRTGDVPRGDLTGWLKLGTNAELAAFAAMAAAAAPRPSASAAARDAASLKTFLADAGVTLSLAGTEKHGGVDAQHVQLAIDPAKLAANPNFRTGVHAGGNGADVDKLMKEVTLSGDLWIDAGSKRILQADVHLVQTSGGSATVDMTVTVRDPDGSVSLAAPSTSVDVPLQKLFSQILQLMSGTMSS